MKKMGEDESLTQYILLNLPKGITIGMDYSLFTQSSASRIKTKLVGYQFQDDKNNIIDDIWGTLKPKYNCNKILILPVEFTGKTVSDKYIIMESPGFKKDYISYIINFYSPNCKFIISYNDYYLRTYLFSLFPFNIYNFIQINFKTYYVKNV